MLVFVPLCSVCTQLLATTSCSDFCIGALLAAPPCDSTHPETFVHILGHTHIHIEKPCAHKPVSMHRPTSFSRQVHTSTHVCTPTPTYKHKSSYCHTPLSAHSSIKVHLHTRKHMQTAKEMQPYV